MKRILIIMLLLSGSLPAINRDEVLRKAEKAYDAKKYREAIEHYEQLLEKGLVSYQLYYNLGNAFYRNNELGKAIYNYELARKLEPNDEDVRINLAIASAKTIDRIESKENFFISAVKSNVLLSLSTSTWAWISIFTILAACVLFFVYLSSASIQVKRISFIIAGLSFLAFILSYFLGYSARQAKYENKFAIVLAKETRVMNEPTSFASSKFGLHEGTKVHVIDRNGEWLLIRLDNGNEGWLKLADVGVI